MAHLVFLDESGLLMAPLVRRSWAPQGQTPILLQRTRSREKVSMIAALTVSPQRRRVGLYFMLLPNANVTTPVLVDFLRQLARHLQKPMVIVWDRLGSHRSVLMKEFLAGRRHIHAVLLPPYAPELNPVEILWSYLKQNPLANRAADEVEELAGLAQEAAVEIGTRQDLLRAFIRSSPLSLCLR